MYMYFFLLCHQTDKGINKYRHFLFSCRRRFGIFWPPGRGRAGVAHESTILHAEASSRGDVAVDRSGVGLRDVDRRG